MRPKPKYRMEISSLAVETTRRCNLDCPMCLRGGPGTGDMSAELLRSFLRQVSAVTEVTFSGGEPSLAIPIMRKFYSICEGLGIEIGGFFVATNGQVNQKELAMFALEAYEKATMPEICAVALSVDPYHEQPRSEIVRGLSFYSDVKEHRDGRDDGWIIPAGSAERNGLYGRPDRHLSEEFSVEETADPDIVRVETIYLSSNGIVYPDCDLSYEEMDAWKDFPGDCPTQAMPAAGCARKLHALLKRGRRKPA